jgi:hypothetical protein
VERSGQAIEVETIMANWKQEEPAGLDGGRQLSFDGTSRMNREVQVRKSVRGSGCDSPGLLGTSTQRDTEDGWVQLTAGCAGAFARMLPGQNAGNSLRF